MKRLRPLGDGDVPEPARPRVFTRTFVLMAALRHLHAPRVVLELVGAVLTCPTLREQHAPRLDMVEIFAGASDVAWGTQQALRQFSHESSVCHDFRLESTSTPTHLQEKLW